MASFLRKLFRRKKQPPLVCAIELDENGVPIGDDPSHQHTGACFIDFEPLGVVELFQAQGCHSCPPALPAIQDATSNPNLLLLTYNVTYFDHLGWRDTFANLGWDRRQQAYAKRWSRTSLFTPQLVVNGVSDGSGAEGRAQVDDIVGRARALQRSMDWHMYVDVNDTDVRIDTDRQEAEAHDIVVVVYNGGDSVVKVGKGPNKGKKIKHRNIVTKNIKIGEWTGGNLTVPLPSPKSSMDPGQEVVVLVQQGGPGGAIVAAARV